MAILNYVLKKGTDLLLAYPVKDGSSARFVAAKLKTEKPLATAQLVYEPANLFEKATIASKLASNSAVAKALATQRFEEAALMAFSDYFGKVAMGRLMVFADSTGLILVDSDKVDLNKN